MTPDILTAVKTALRLTGDVHDIDLLLQIEACKDDLTRAGIRHIDEKDPTTRLAIIRFCKANFGFSEHKAAFQAAYDNMVNKMRMEHDKYVAAPEDDD